MLALSYGRLFNPRSGGHNKLTGACVQGDSRGGRGGRGAPRGGRGAPRGGGRGGAGARGGAKTIVVC